MTGANTWDNEGPSTICRTQATGKKGQRSARARREPTDQSGAHSVPWHLELARRTGDSSISEYSELLKSVGVHGRNATWRSAITQDNLGAWLIKCDPEAKFDLPGAMAAGMDVITRWSVVPGYRADMMAPNDKIILWVSGDGRRMGRGI